MRIIIYLNLNEKLELIMNVGDRGGIWIPTIKNLHVKICFREQKPVINVPLQVLTNYEGAMVFPCNSAIL